MSSLNNKEFENIWEAFYPVIQAARKVRDRYTPIIDNKRRPVLIAPDACGELIEALNKAELKFNIYKEEETQNGKEKSQDEEKKPSTD